MALISFDAKFQLSSSTIVNVAAHGVIIMLGLMLPPPMFHDEAWRSAREGSMLCCAGCSQYVK